MSLLKLFLAIFSSFLYAGANLVDKKIIHGEEEDESPLAVIAVGVMFDLVFLVPIAIFCFWTGNLPSADIFWPLFFNGITYTLGSWFFFFCIKTEDVSRSTAIWQVVPIFGLFLGAYGLNEILNPMVIGGIIALVIGGFLISLNKGGKFNQKLIVLMLLSSVMYGFNDFVIAKYGRELVSDTGIVNSASVAESMPAIMADLLGKFFFGIVALVSARVRFKSASLLKHKSGLMLLSILLYTSGDILADLSKIFIPLATVQAILCLQPLFVLLGATVLIKYWKGFPEEKEDEKVPLWLKMLGIGLMVVGGILLSI